MRMRLRDVEAALEEHLIIVHGDPVPDDDYEPADLAWLNEEQHVDEPDVEDDYYDDDDPYRLFDDWRYSDLGYSTVDNVHGHTDLVDELGQPVCATCYSAKMPNRGEGTACDACQAQFMTDCEHDFD